jgi:hypothetical protein
VTDTTATRRIAYPVRYGAWTLRRRARSHLLATAALALAVAFVVALGAVATLSESAILTRGLHEVDPGRRNVQVGHFGVPPVDGGASSVADTALRILHGVTGREPVHVVQYKTLQNGGSTFALSGIDGASRFLRITSGRAPRTACRPERCEVVIAGGRGRVPVVDGVRIAVVGRGEISSPVPFSRLLGTRAAAVGDFVGRGHAPVFMVAEGAAATGSLPALSSLYRSDVWIAPLDEGDVRPWNLDGLRDRLQKASAAIALEPDQYDLASPVPQLEAAADRAHRSRSRLLLVGGQGVALLVAFAALAGAAGRREVSETLQRLRWFGARPWQGRLVVATRVLLQVVTALLAGLLLGLLAAALLAAGGDLPAGRVIESALFDARTLGLVAAAVGVSLVVLVGAQVVRGSRERLRPLDVVGIAAAAFTVWVLLEDHASDRTLLLLPGAVALATGIAAARLFPPLLRLAEPALRRARSLRLAAISLTRRRSEGPVAAGFVAVSVALSLFAFSYFGTLRQGTDDQLDYRAPADFTVREDLSPTGLVPVLDAAPLARYSSLPGVRSVTPVIRQNGALSARPNVQLTALGVPAAAIDGLRGFRGDFSSRSSGDLSRSLHWSGSGEPGGLQLPARARRLTVRASVEGDPVTLRLAFLTPRGTYEIVNAGTVGRVARDATVELPPGARGGKLAAFLFGRVLEVEGHSKGEVPAQLGTITFRSVTADGTPLALRRDDLTGVGNVIVRERGGIVRARYLVSNEKDSFVRFLAPGDTEHPGAIVSPEVAAAADDRGLVAVALPAGFLAVHVDGVARHFPTLDGPFVVLDRDAMFQLANALRPGGAETNELWIDSNARTATRAALRRGPFRALQLRERASLEHELRSDPLARATLAVVLAAALEALLVAVLGAILLLGVGSGEQQADLDDLEEQGLPPSELRAHLRLRAVLIIAVGLLAGIVAGVALSRAVVDLVSLTAGGLTGNPPLVAAGGGLGALVVAAALGAVLVAAVSAASLHAFRGREAR